MNLQFLCYFDSWRFISVELILGITSIDESNLLVIPIGVSIKYRKLALQIAKTKAKTKVCKLWVRIE